MYHGIVRRVLMAGIISFAPVGSHADPLAAIDKDSVDFGSFTEGEKDELEAVFVIRNAGDQQLRVTQVRPSCGCTVVDYDRAIDPGDSGSIRPVVDIRGMTGAISKSVRVVTNADSGAELRLVITATITPLIDVSTRFVTLSATKGETKTVLMLSTERDNLHVKRVEFRPMTNRAKNASTLLPHSLLMKGDADGDGSYGYELTLTCPASLSPSRGAIIIKTNHPEKETVQVRGLVRE